jgi:hypothetical protein
MSEKALSHKGVEARFREPPFLPIPKQQFFCRKFQSAKRSKRCEPPREFMCA